MDQAIVLEAGALLAQGRKQEGILIPVGDASRQAGRHQDLAAMNRLEGRIAADMIGVGVGIDQPGQASAGQGVVHQGDGLTGMGDVAAVHQGGLVPVEKQDVVGRQPTPFQDQERGREMQAHGRGGLSGSSPGGWAGVFLGSTMTVTVLAEGKGGRPQPRQ